jgi:ADP-heptose:LPS heptosyltransferase
MQSLIRSLAVAVRRVQERRKNQKLSQQFLRWQSAIAELPAVGMLPDTIAIVRLDDIGDYLLWRNMLPAYRAFYSDKRIILIGNKVWAPIFEALDLAEVDEFIALDKGRYLQDESYRKGIWLQLRQLGASETICVSRTRPLLLDDCITTALGSGIRIGAKNSFSSQLLNELSDHCYSRLLPGLDAAHEFVFNRHFTESITANSSLPQFLSLDIPVAKPSQKVILFIGASAKSKRWPVKHWVALVELLRLQGRDLCLLGGPSDREMAAAIVAEVPVENQVGSLSLMETLACIKGSAALVSGDTMAAHAGVGLSVPTLIIANGVNAARFVAYEEAGYDCVKTLYTRPFLRAGKPTQFVAVSNDMASILPETVAGALSQLLLLPVSNR